MTNYKCYCLEKVMIHIGICRVLSARALENLWILHEGFQDCRWICHDKEQCHLGIRITEHETGLDLGDFMNLLCRSSALLLIGTHLLSLILLELSRKLSWQLTTRRIILMNVDYATVLITQEWWLAALSKWLDCKYFIMADELLISMLLLRSRNILETPSL